MAVQVFCPAAAAVGEVLAMGDQAMMQMAREQRDAVGAGVVAEEEAGHADLAASPPRSRDGSRLFGRAAQRKRGTNPK